MFKLKIGHNPAANMLPMFYFFDKDNPLCELVEGVPAQHNHLLATGQIHMAPISAFSFGEHSTDYHVLSDLSVSARGKIDSILLYSKFELADLDGKSLALTNTSATSVNLLKIILEKFLKVTPRYTTVEPNLENMLQQHDGALLIADDALLGISENPGYYIFDLSQEWYKHTGLPMTFAVWAVSDQVLQANPSQVNQVHRLLLAAKQAGLQDINLIIQQCVATLGKNYEFWRQYFSQLRYDLQPDLLQGLAKYFEYCVELGLLEHKPVLRIFPIGVD